MYYKRKWIFLMSLAAGRLCKECLVACRNMVKREKWLGTWDNNYQCHSGG